MTSTLVKICGLSTPETLDATINAGADWVGLVTFAPSPRHVEPEAAKPLADHARGRATIVSLSVNADDATLDAIASHIKPDIFQLQGKETPGRVADIKARYETSVMKAIGVSTVDDLEKITPYLGIADH
ncbi:MAG: N-(5'-phosphoribosyl)anthranilate isomerase, partial [Pseudomonadota bacterium]